MIIGGINTRHRKGLAQKLEAAYEQPTFDLAQFAEDLTLKLPGDEYHHPSTLPMAGGIKLLWKAPSFHSVPVASQEVGLLKTTYIPPVFPLRRKALQLTWWGY